MNFLKTHPLIQHSAKTLSQMMPAVFQTRQLSIVQQLTDALKTSFQTFCVREIKKFKTQTEKDKPEEKKGVTCIDLEAEDDKKQETPIKQVAQVNDAIPEEKSELKPAKSALCTYQTLTPDDHVAEQKKQVQQPSKTVQQPNSSKLPKLDRLPTANLPNLAFSNEERTKRRQKLMLRQVQDWEEGRGRREKREIRMLGN